MFRSICTALPLKKNGQLIIRRISSKPKTTESVKHSNHKQQQEQGQPWQPTKRVSRVTMEKIRSLAALYPDHYNSVSLATEFRISPEAVKRILKSKFRPDPSIADRQEKNRYAAMGVRKQQIQSKSITFSQASSSSSDMRSSARTATNYFSKYHPSPSSSTSATIVSARKRAQ